MFKLSSITLMVVMLAAVYKQTAGFSSSNFTETNECQENQVCIYDYAVVQQYFAKEGEQNHSVTAEIEIMCDSVGEYNGEDAVMYCLSVRDIHLIGTMFEDDDENNEQAEQHRQQHMLKMFAGHFCFVQTADGKIAAVYYTSTQSDEAVNFKKAIAAAFQANFKGTETEEEVDPQSVHLAHYKITSKEQVGLVKMHRSINSDDVLEYSTGAPKRDVILKKDENIEYQSGKLRHSDGNTTVRISKADHVEQDGDFSSLFSAKGHYSLDLKQCSSLTSRLYSRKRRSVGDEIEDKGEEHSLKANYNQTNSDKEELEVLRERLPSVAKALNQVAENPADIKTVDLIENLLVLEFKQGVLPGFSPALSDVLEYLVNVQDSDDPGDQRIREIIYSLLGTEGSFQSQMVLFDALQMDILSEEEKISLINEIALLDNPHIEFVRLLKQYWYSVSSNIDEAEPLLLSFGALASRSSSEVEEFVVSTLLKLESASSINADEKILILAMGNTGSKLVIKSLLSYLNNPNQEIQLITIQSLSKLVVNMQVLDALENILIEQPDEDFFSTVAEVLVTGLEYITNNDAENIESYSDILSHHSILTTLATAVLETNNTNLQAMVQTFLKEVGGEQAYVLLDNFESHTKRDTDWDSSSNSVYNLVASHAERQSDVNIHPTHRAYIWGKRLGIDEANIEVAAGVFAGRSNDCNNMKVYGRAVAKGKLLSRRSTFADVKVNLQKTRTYVEGRVYANIGGNTLADYSHRYNLTSLQCYNYNRQFFERRYRLFRYRYSVFVYVATIRLTVEMHTTLAVGFEAELCGQTRNTELVTADARFTPRIGASISGGVRANLLSLARGGITATANFVYQLEPSASAQACRQSCSLQYQACAALYDSWPGNTLDIETWYQIRKISWCGGWIKLPCIKWGKRRRWDTFSWRWSLGSRSRQSLYESCQGTSNPQCRSLADE